MPHETCFRQLISSVARSIVIHAAGIISLLTHICICVVLNTLVHAQLTYGHQPPCHLGPNTKACNPSCSDSCNPQPVSNFQPSTVQAIGERSQQSKSLGIRSKLLQSFLHRLCNVLGEALQVVAPNKGLLNNLRQRQAFAASNANSRCFLLAALLTKVGTRQDSWPVLPEVMTFTGYCFLLKLA